VGAAPVPAATLRAARVLLGVAIAVSVVHYVDNFANWADYPHPPSGPDPSRAVIAGAWVVFTASALAGYVLLRRGHVTAAALCLALYSGSGLVGLAHYTVEGATDMPWWRQAHVLADILCGVAVLLFAVRLVRRPPVPA
jgi:hypothetical protein